MMNIYQSQVLKVYEALRNKAEKELKTRKKEIYTKIPEIKKIDDKIARLSIQLSINILKNIDDREKYITSLKENITDLRIKKSELLVSKNYPMDYLEIKYTCSKCNDTGFIGTKKCSCYKNKFLHVYYKKSRLKDILREHNFDKFSMDVYSTHKIDGHIKSPRKNMEKIMSEVKTFLKNFNTPSCSNMLFYGNSGTGKTFLSHCIAKYLLNKGFFIVYRPAKQLSEDLREIAFEDSYDTKNLLVNCDLLIIDDLGTEPKSDFSKSELFNLLNTKLLNKKPMLVSTNLSIEELSKHYSERITSRLFGNFTLCKFYGEDIRVSKNLEKNEL